MLGISDVLNGFNTRHNLSLPQHYDSCRDNAVNETILGGFVALLKCPSAFYAASTIKNPPKISGGLSQKSTLWIPIPPIFLLFQTACDSSFDCQFQVSQFHGLAVAKVVTLDHETRNFSPVAAIAVRRVDQLQNKGPPMMENDRMVKRHSISLCKAVKRLYNTLFLTLFWRESTRLALTKSQLT